MAKPDSISSNNQRNKSMTTNTTSRVSAYAPIIAKAEKFNNEMAHLFASVSGYNVRIEYNGMIVFLDESEDSLCVWDESLSEKDEVLNLKLMLEKMGFSCWINENNLLEVSGEGCNEEFNVEKMLKPIEAILLYLETYNIPYEISKFGDDCLPVELDKRGGGNEPVSFLLWHDICKDNNSFISSWFLSHQIQKEVKSP